MIDFDSILYGLENQSLEFMSSINIEDVSDQGTSQY